MVKPPKTPCGKIKLSSLGTAQQAVIRKLIAGWQRRNRHLLVLGANNPPLLELIWELGFDVTVQDYRPARLGNARELLGNRAAYMLGSYDHFPFNDCSFHFVVMLDDSVSYETLRSLLPEIDRVCTNGCIMLFQNMWSLGYLCAHKQRQALQGHTRQAALSPRKLYLLLKDTFPAAHLSWCSTLLAPQTITQAYRNGFWNTLLMPFPCGEVAGVKIDFGKSCTGTPLLLHEKKPIS